MQPDPVDHITVDFVATDKLIVVEFQAHEIWLGDKAQLSA